MKEDGDELLIAVVNVTISMGYTSELACAVIMVSNLPSHASRLKTTFSTNVTYSGRLKLFFFLIGETNHITSVTIYHLFYHLNIFDQLLDKERCNIPTMSVYTTFLLCIHSLRINKQIIESIRNVILIRNSPRLVRIFYLIINRNRLQQGFKVCIDNET